MPTEIHEISYPLEYKAFTREHGFKARLFVGNDDRLLVNRLFLKDFSLYRKNLYINKL
jgi:hypothetical protein